MVGCERARRFRAFPGRDQPSHNPKVAGSNPAPATTQKARKLNGFRAFLVFLVLVSSLRGNCAATLSRDAVVEASLPGDEVGSGAVRLVVARPADVK